MSAIAKGLWSLLFLIVLVLALAFTVPLLMHLLVELPQRGWELVSRAPRARIQIRITGNLRRLNHQLTMLRWQSGLIGIRFSTALLKLSNREVGRRELALAREIQADNPRFQVQCITTHQGRCRVVVKYLGGWS